MLLKSVVILSRMLTCQVVSLQTMKMMRMARVKQVARNDAL
jgi:hypothetical protein